MQARGFQLGYAEAMYRNGSLNFPIGMGRTITECELMRKYKTPLYVSARREMLEQTAKIAKEFGIDVRCVKSSQFDYENESCDMVVMCETVMHCTPCQKILTWASERKIPVYMNRSV